MSSSRFCPEWKTQKKILEIKFTENVSFFEAKKRIENDQSPKKQTIPSYSQVAQKTLDEKNQTIKRLTDENLSLKAENKTLHNEVAAIRKELAEVQLSLAILQSQRASPPIIKAGGEDGESMDFTESAKRARSSSDDDEPQDLPSKKGKSPVGSEDIPPKCPPTTRSPCPGQSTVSASGQKMESPSVNLTQKSVVSKGTRSSSSFGEDGSPSSSRERSPPNGGAESRPESRSRSPRDRSFIPTAVQNRKTKRASNKTKQEGKPDVPQKPSASIPTSNKYDPITPP